MSTARNKVAVAGRGGGKSELAIAEAVETLADGFDKQVIIVGQTYAAQKRRYWDDLSDLLRPAIRDESKTDLRLKLKNGAWVQLFGADKPDNLRNMHVDKAIIDEEDYCPPDLFARVIEPMLRVKRGRSVHLGTPDGFGELYKHYTRGEEGKPGWQAFAWTSLDVPHIDPEEVLALRSEMDADLWEQEYLGSFKLRTGAVFRAFSRERHVKPTPYLPHLPVYAGEDFNFGCQVTVFFQEEPREGQRPLIRVFAECVSRDKPTYEHADRMLELLESYRVDPRQRDVVIYSDATGEARQRAGYSDVHALKERGFKVLHRPANPRVEDRLNAHRAMLKAADDTVSIQIDPSCKLTVESHEKLAYRRGTNPPDVDKTQGWDHAVEAFGYAIEYRHPLKGRSRALYP